MSKMQLLDITSKYWDGSCFNVIITSNAFAPWLYEEKQGIEKHKPFKVDLLVKLRLYRTSPEVLFPAYIKNLVNIDIFSKWWDGKIPTYHYKHGQHVPMLQMEIFYLQWRRVRLVIWNFLLSHENVLLNRFVENAGMKQLQSLSNT